MQWARIFGKPLTWADLPWLRALTKLPLILKGICHPDDARRAIDAGVDAIYCSNHGGRQANGGLAAIDMLPGVVKAAGASADRGLRQRGRSVRRTDFILIVCYVHNFCCSDFGFVVI